MFTLLLVRHGETEENARGEIQGQLDGRLTERGRRQIALLAERLRSERIDAAYSSDLSRARETALGILTHHGCELVVDDLLRERSFGALEGKTIEVVREAVRASGLGYSSFTPSGGESLMTVRDRAIRFLHKISPRHSGHTVLVASHGGFNRAMLSYLLDHSIDETRIDQANTCLNRLTVDISTRAVRGVPLLNCTMHLEDEL